MAAALIECGHHMTDQEFRARHIGAAEVAALFDGHPHLTAFELFHRKAGSLPEIDLSDNERVRWGQALEPIIIAEACRRNNWRYQPSAPVSNGKGLGGHPDGIITCSADRSQIIEVKCADWLVAKKWGDEPPLNYLLQMQVYMGLTGLKGGTLVALVGGNELRQWHYDFRPALFAEIETRVADFWQSIEAGLAPTPDFSRDGESLAALYKGASDEAADLRTDNRAAELCRLLIEGQAEKKSAEQKVDAAKAELLAKLGTARTGLLNEHRLSVTVIADTPGKLITADMVGTTIGARKGSVRLNLREIA